jgi:hypothetical protein
VDVSKAKREFLTWDEASIDAKVKAFGPEAEAIVGAGSIRITKTTDVRRTGGRKR